MRKQTKLWKQKNGEKIRICDMSDAHLENTMRMLKRYAERLYNATFWDACAFLDQCRGDGAIDAMERELVSLGRQTWEDFVPEIYWKMQDDQNRRYEAKSETLP